MANLYLDICLSDIPKELIKTAANGKKYLKALIRPRKDIDRDGYDHYIAAWVPKDQRGQDDRPAFIGRAQDRDAREALGERLYQEHKDALPESNKPAPADDNDLPFDSRPGYAAKLPGF